MTTALIMRPVLPIRPKLLPFTGRTRSHAARRVLIESSAARSDSILLKQARQVGGSAGDGPRGFLPPIFPQSHSREKPSTSGNRHYV